VAAGAQPWASFDCALGFVVCARTAARARDLVAKIREHDDEPETFGTEGAAVWLDPTMSVCVRLDDFGRDRVVLRDFVRG
jgi:hypothetical protein